MGRLRKHEKCPLHNSYFCCGRESYAISKDRGISRGPARKLDDPNHPRGWRELCSVGEIRRRKNILVEQQKGICGICHEPMTDYREITVDHIVPSGMGAAWRDDHWDNLQAAHLRCNLEKGSIHPRRELSA